MRPAHGTETVRTPHGGEEIEIALINPYPDVAFTFAPSDCIPSVQLADAARALVRAGEADGLEELRTLLGDGDAGGLIDALFGARPVVLRAAGRTDRFAHLYSIERARKVCDAGCVDSDDVKIVSARGVFQTGRFFGRRRHSTVKSLGDRIVEFVAGGGTFNVARIYRHSPGAAELAHVLNRLFRARVSASAFVTGPRGQAFPAHWDTFDTLIFQASGQKRWAIYEPVVRAPLADVHYCTRYSLENLRPLFEVDLAAGDLMHVPRGYPHMARTTRDHSVHVTVGVHTPNWHELFACLLQRALIETRTLESFRSDCHALNAPLEVRRKQTLRMLDRLFEVARHLVTADFLVDERASDSRIEASKPDLEVGSSAGEAAYVRVGGVCFVDRLDGRTLFRWRGRRLSLPETACETVSFIARRSSFRAADLPADLSEVDRCHLLEALCSMGFLLYMDHNEAGLQSSIVASP